MSKDMKRHGQKEHSKQGDKQNKFIFTTKRAMIHLKWFYVVGKNRPMCVSNTTKTTGVK